METDFITAFGRLLRDGKLRDVFSADPRAAAAQIQLKQADLAAWSQLVPADVEFQAQVLLRKRLDLVKYFAPETCRRPGDGLWPIFLKYARINWPPEGAARIVDAFQFCRFLEDKKPGATEPSELNRLTFALGRSRLAVHWVNLPMKNGNPRRGFQIFLRVTGDQWREFFLYVRL